MYRFHGDFSSRCLFMQTGRRIGHQLFNRPSFGCLKIVSLYLYYSSKINKIFLFRGDAYGNSYRYYIFHNSKSYVNDLKIRVAYFQHKIILCFEAGHDVLGNNFLVHHPLVFMIDFCCRCKNLGQPMQLFFQEYL